jgi:phenylacetate-CoA ligase
VNQFYDHLPIFLQNLACSWAGYRRASARFTPYFQEVLRDWEKSIHDPVEALRDRQWRLLERLVRRTREQVPFYKELALPSSRSDPEQAIAETLERIVPLEKSVYRERWREFLARDIPPRKMLRVATSGTTGTPLPVWHTLERIAEGYAAVWRQRRACGVQLEDPHMTFAGQMIVPLRQRKPPFWRHNAYGKQTLFSVYHLSQKNMSAYVDAIHATRARYVQGYPSALHLAARSLLDMGRPLPSGRLAAVFTSSESLLGFQRDAIEKAFGAPLFDHYAATELAVSMTACAHHRLHVDMEFCIVEVEPVEETDEYVRGPLLVTGLGSDASPFLRYRIGDVGMRAKRPCPCGRPGDVFLDIDGRIEDYVMTPDERLVGRMDHVFKSQYDVAEAQILQERKDAITVLIVPRTSYSQASQKNLISELRGRLGDAIRIDVRLVDGIPREPNGKLRAVKSAVGRIAP